jgi:hypothetical protein
MPIQPSECVAAIFFSLDFPAPRLEHNPKDKTDFPSEQTLRFPGDHDRSEKSDHIRIMIDWRLAIENSCAAESVFTVGDGIESGILMNLV